MNMTLEQAIAAGPAVLQVFQHNKILEKVIVNSNLLFADMGIPLPIVDYNDNLLDVENDSVRKKKQKFNDDDVAVISNRKKRKLKTHMNTKRKTTDCEVISTNSKIKPNPNSNSKSKVIVSVDIALKDNSKHKEQTYKNYYAKVMYCIYV